MASTIDETVALRIALAARALGGVPLRTLIDALHGCLGDSLDEAALGRVTVANLKAAFGGGYDLDGEEDGTERWRRADIEAFKSAVEILWGAAGVPALDVSAEKALLRPRVEAYAEGEMPRSVRVAVASNSGEGLNGHFGSAARFLIFQVSATELRLVAARSTAGAEASGDKNGFRVELIRDCRVLYVVSIGGPASAKVIRADIHIVSNAAGGPARTVLRDLQRVIAGTPPPWLAKALGASGAPAAAR